MRRGFGIVALVLVILLGVGIGVSAYNAGVTHGLAEATTEGGQVVRVIGPGYGYFPFGLFLFPLLFFFLIFGIGRRMAFGHHRGWGGLGHHGDWKEGRERFEERAREWHQKEHEPKSENAPPGASV